MNQADIRSGETYGVHWMSAGKEMEKRRTVLSIAAESIPGPPVIRYREWWYPEPGGRYRHQRSPGPEEMQSGMGRCSRASFARWAEFHIPKQRLIREESESIGKTVEKGAGSEHS